MQNERMLKVARRRRTTQRPVRLATASGRRLLRHEGGRLSAHRSALPRPISPLPRSRSAGQIASDGRIRNVALPQRRRGFPRRCRGGGRSSRNESGVHPDLGLAHVRYPTASMFFARRVRSPGLRLPGSNAGQDGRYGELRCSCERRPCSLRWRVHSSLMPPLPGSLPTRGLHR